MTGLGEGIGLHNWQLHKVDITLAIGEVHSPRLGVRAHPSAGLQHTHHGNFIAAMKLGAPQAVLPCLKRENAALHFLETHLMEKLGDISEGEDRIERIGAGFSNKQLEQKRE